MTISMKNADAYSNLSGSRLKPTTCGNNTIGNSMCGPISKSIISKINQAIKPTLVKVINESPNHRYHLDESHLKLIVVSDYFKEMPLLQRHRKLYEIIDEEMKQIHALTILAKTVEQWEKENGTIEPSPSCVKK